MEGVVVFEVMILILVNVLMIVAVMNYSTPDSHRELYISPQPLQNPLSHAVVRLFSREYRIMKLQLILASSLRTSRQAVLYFRTLLIPAGCWFTHASPSSLRLRSLRNLAEHRP